MRVVGLTGGIASGKSTVARMLALLGAPIVDADQLARQVVAKGQPAFDDIVHTFGTEVLDKRGDLDRKRLGALVFADPAKRAQLNAITHPRIASATQTELARLRERGAPVAIYEAALIVENQLHTGLDGLIVVAADEATQLARLQTRDGLTVEDARTRIAAQKPLAEKLAVANYVIDTGRSLDETRRQVQEVWRRIGAATKGP